MLRSMTGFGKTVLELPDKKITFEIKSLNSKQFDLNTRIPGVIKEKEMEIRSLVSSKLERGKIELIIFLEKAGDSSNYSFNKDLVKTYYNELFSISKEIDQESFNAYLPLIMKLPDVMKPEIDSLDPNEWIEIKKALQQSIDQLNNFRKQEGNSLEKVIKTQIHNIVELLEKVPQYEKQRIITIRERINKNLEEFAGDKKIDQNRLEQEMIYYLEKIDVTEEKIRLKKHCEYFLETMEEERSVGKKLNFISHEIGREINTLGSKANYVDIQKIVVQMKDELEKIKEQLFNIL